MVNDTDKKEISFIEVEEVLKKNKIRTRTIFTRKSRKLSDVLDDLAKKWSKLSKEDKKIINGYFMGSIFSDAIKKEYDLSVEDEEEWNVFFMRI